MSATQVWNNIVAYSLQIGLLVALGAMAPALLGLRVARARLLFWQVLLAACLALPWVRPWHEAVIAVDTTAVAVTQAVSAGEANAPVRPALPPVTQVVLWLFAAGVAVRLAWLATGLLKLSRYRRHGRALPLPAEWNGSARRANLLLSDEISGPVTFGFFRPVILLPAGYPSMPDAMREAILFHEMLHVERRDWLFTLGEELLRSVFWFHPAIWWVLGEIQLAREQTVDQAVVEMTQARDPYVDTLLAMAGCSVDGREPQLDLAPAPLFLRRRHLKQRVLGIVQEVKMSKTRLIVAQAAALAVMAAACWVVTGAIPLQAQAQMVADGPGVTVSLNGSQLMHRTPVEYPAAALAKGVEGTVVAQVRLDANGEVIDAAVLSGPDELRRGVQQSLLNWHFDKSAGSTTRVVNIAFVKPAVVTEAVLPSRVQTNVPAPAAVAPAIVRQPQLQLNQGQLQLAAPSGPPAGPPKLTSIEILGLSDSAREQLLAQLPVHVGDALSNDVLSQTTDAVRRFDEHLSVGSSVMASGNWVLRIRTTDAPPAVTTMPAPPVPGAMRVGANVMAANLINAAKPVYPPLAKMARVQGTVRFQATIAKDGTMEDLQVVSGPPLLIPAALEAVKQWVYKPTYLNGAPVEVITTIDVNFSLADGPPPAPAQ